MLVLAAAVAWLCLEIMGKNSGGTPQPAFPAHEHALTVVCQPRPATRT